MNNKKQRSATHRRSAKAKNDVSEILSEMASDVGALFNSPRDIESRLLLMLSELKDREVLKDDSLIRAKLAAKAFQTTGDLAPCMWLILLAIEKNDKSFFIDFGKCLSGEIKDSTLFDRRDRDMAEIVVSHPHMSTKEAVRELHKRGHTTMTEDNFRTWKMRLLRARRKFDALLARA